MRGCLLVALLAGCAGQTAGPSTLIEDEDDPAARASHVAPALDGFRASYILLYRGARIGEARERFRADDEADGGYRFERAERVVVRREGEAVVTETRISVDTDVALYARRLVIERISGKVRTSADAERILDGAWQVSWGTSAPRIVDGAAVPSTLVPLLVAGAGAWPGRAFEGRILLEGSGLAVADLTVDISEDRKVASAVIRSPSGELRARALLDDRGYVAEAGEADGVASRRATEAELAASFDPPEIVEAAAIRVEGQPSGRPGLELVIEGVQAPVPELAELPGQSIRLDGGAWRVRVDPARPSVDLRPVRERTHHVSRALVDDMGAPVVAPEEAMTTGRGDCTAHAIVLKKLLEERGFTARLVTGFLLVDGELRRHRWVVVEVARHWVPVDPTLDEVPASPARIALAVHGSTPEELAFIDDVAFSGWDGARAHHAP